MERKPYSEWSDEALRAEAGKQRRRAVLRAFVIGFMMGVIIYSLAKSTWGFFTLIPLFFLYRLWREPEGIRELRRECVARGLGTGK